MEQISATTQLVRIDPTGGTLDGAQALINGGAYTGWQSFGSFNLTIPDEVRLYNKQVIDIAGLVADEQSFTAASIRVEQPEPVRASLGINKDINAAPYGFVREYHLFTTEELNGDDFLQIFNLINPTLPGFTSTAGVSSQMNENQLIYGLCREYNSILNFASPGDTFAQDWRLTPSYENVIGNGYPVAQSKIHYTRIVYCWMNPTTQVSSGASIVQGLDVPYARASLIGTIRKPNFQEYLATLANNEAIGSW